MGLVVLTAFGARNDMCQTLEKLLRRTLVRVTGIFRIRQRSNVHCVPKKGAPDRRRESHSITYPRFRIPMPKRMVLFVYSGPHRTLWPHFINRRPEIYSQPSYAQTARYQGIHRNTVLSRLQVMVYSYFAAKGGGTRLQYFSQIERHRRVWRDSNLG